jgi:hypothetical protein
VNEELMDLVRKTCLSDTKVRAPECLSIIERRSKGEMSAKRFDQKRYDHNRFVKDEPTRHLSACELGVGLIPATDIVTRIYPFMAGRVDGWSDFLTDYSHNLTKQVRSTVLWLEPFYVTPKDKPMVVLSRYLYWESGISDFLSVLNTHPEAPQMVTRAGELKKAIYDLVLNKAEPPRGISNV